MLLTHAAARASRTAPPAPPAADAAEPAGDPFAAPPSSLNALLI